MEEELLVRIVVELPAEGCPGKTVKYAVFLDKLTDGEMVRRVIVNGIGNKKLQAGGKDKEQEDPQDRVPSTTAPNDPIEEGLCVFIPHGYFFFE
jgi:hypothetical protein